jgi:rhodanese-related sulfurtransferase
LIQDDSYILIDIRNEWEMEEWGVISWIDDHKNVYDPEHVNYLENLDKHGKYLFYCAHGVRSSFLTEHLLWLWFETVYDLAWGVAWWEEAGLDFIAWEE